jgi:hypothetical protein
LPEYEAGRQAGRQAGRLIICRKYAREKVSSRLRKRKPRMPDNDHCNKATKEKEMKTKEKLREFLFIIFSLGIRDFMRLIFSKTFSLNHYYILGRGLTAPP